MKSSQQSQIDIIEKICSTTKPLVVINCITYNHAKYIRDALDGFVMQQTDFAFVAIVHDDASTDSTSDIVKEYSRTYPDIILPIFEKENLYSKRDGSIGRILRAVIRQSGAKYVAHCEGDDYWTDPLKLQKQVDFLEAHPDYSMVFANARYVYEDGRAGLEHQLENREYKPIELYREYICPTPTVLHRVDVYDSPAYKEVCKIKGVLFGDMTLFVCCGLIGKLRGSSEVVCDYRRLSTGASQQLNTQLNRYLRNHIKISRIFGKEYADFDKERFRIRFAVAAKHILSNYPDNLLFVLRYIGFAPDYIWQRFCLKIKRKFSHNDNC